MAIDDVDQRIIKLLRHNCRRSVSDIATELDLSRATVRNRMERLENDGTIVGYTVILRADAVEQPIRGIMMIEIEGQGTERVINTLVGFPEITSIHTTNGRWDLIVEIATITLSEFDAILRRIRLVQGVSSSETSLLLATPRTTKARLSG